MTNYEKLIRDLPIEALAKLLIEKDTYDDGDYVFDGEDEHWEPWEVEYYRFLSDTYATEYEAYEVALDWLNREVNADSLKEIKDIQSATVLIPDWEE